MTRRYDVVLVGGGHNALVAAAYLGRSGRSVLILERASRVGGAAVSEQAFPGVPARLSRYSYLVSLLPSKIIADLGLRISLASRSVSSYTPTFRDGHPVDLLVEREPGSATVDSFRALTGSDREFTAWVSWYESLARMAEVVAPTLLEPLPRKEELRAKVIAATGATVWDQVFEHPIGEAITSTFADDLVRGVVATDALIGTHTSLHSPDLLANRCLLYHVVGNGTGEWRVPVGGMGTVTAELERAARAAGAEVVTDADVTSIAADGHTAEIAYETKTGPETVAAQYVLAAVAPYVLDRLRGQAPRPRPAGAQLKINILLTRLPRLLSGADPRAAFAGTFHLDETYTDLETAYQTTLSGGLPASPPGEMYCHTLTDPSIVDDSLSAEGWHTLTLFGLHCPADLFTMDNAALRAELVDRYLAGLNRHLADPIESCLARDGEGNPCLEARTPLDLEAELAMPGGHIFHGDLSWPYDTGSPGPWGVETDMPNLFLCSAGAPRGGGVSGIPGHNAAMAVLAAG